MDSWNSKTIEQRRSDSGRRLGVTQVAILTPTRFYKSVNELNLTMKVTVNCPQKTIWVISKLVSIFCPNLVVLSWIGGELWHRQAQNGVHLAFQVEYDLKGQGQSPPSPQKNKRDLNQVALHLLSKFGGSSLKVWGVMAQTSLELTDTHTDTLPEPMLTEIYVAIWCHLATMS